MGGVGGAVRAAGVGHGLEPVKHCFSWQGEGGEGGEGGGGWAWIGARKTLLFMAGAVGAVRAVWTRGR